MLLEMVKSISPLKNTALTFQTDLKREEYFWADITRYYQV
jgi:hypothetical protein